MGKGEDSDSSVNSCVKFLLFFFNFIFWLIGGVFIGVGAWAFYEKNRFEFHGSSDRDIDIYDLVFDLTILMMVLGAVIFTLGFCGCIGALRENVCLLKFFSYVLGILFLIQVIIAILAFVFSSQIKNKVVELLEKEGVSRYMQEDQDLTNFVDWFQETFQCCGVGFEGYKDWNNNMYFSCNDTNRSLWKCAVPFSCCRHPDDIEKNLINIQCGYNAQTFSLPQAQPKIYTTGCVQAVIQVAEDNLYVIGGVVLGLAVPQLIGIFLSRILANQIEDNTDRWI